MAITGSQKAYQYALMGACRMGTTRMGYTSGLIYILLDGAARRDRVQYDSLSIDDELDETPNRCRFRLIGITVGVGAPVVITLGSTNGARIFAGHVIEATEVLGGRPDQIRCDVSCVDYTWLLGFRKVTRRYTTEAASDIVKELVATYGSDQGFTTKNVQPFGSLGELTFTNEDLTEAITRVARRLGAYWYVDYFKDVHLFQTESLGGDPEPLTPAHKSLAINEFSYDADLSQTLTRVYVEGRGSRLLSSVNVGDTRIPLEAVDMFEVSTDVFLKASFQGSDGGAQHLSFNGIVPGGGGSIIGPGASPGAAPAVAGTNVSGGAVTPGVHGYGFTYVTASGESLPSVTASMTLGAFPTPAVAATAGFPDDSHLGELVEGGRYRICYTYGYYAGSGVYTDTLPSPASDWSIASSPSMYTGGVATFFVPRSPDPSVTFLNIYRTTNNGSTFYLDAHISHTPGTGNQVVYAGGTVKDSDLPARPALPSAATFFLNTVNVSGIAAGPTGTTARKLYRTAAGAAQLKLLTTLADNTTATYQDKLADASLGANVPATDTSGLKQPEGQLNPGATSIRVSSIAPFDSGGGWAVIGNGEQIVRYSALTSDSLTGIPASGIGAITAVVVYNSTISQAPMLTGIPAGSIGPRPLVAGDEIYLVVTCDDTARQADLAARIGGNGLREEWLQDRRLSIPEARARGQATLQLRTLPQATLNYRCRDLRTAAGKTITVNLPAPVNISGTFRIQQVHIENFRTHADQMPTFHVSASSSRFSFEDLLARIKPRV